MTSCNKCRGTGWRLLPVVDPVDALPCDRCDAPQQTDTKQIMRAHGLLPDVVCSVCDGDGFVTEKNCPDIERWPCREMGCGHDCPKCAGSGYAPLAEGGAP